MDSCVEEDEMAVILTLVQKFNPETFLEIGTCKGGTAARILMQIPGIKRYEAVDYADSSGSSQICQFEEIGVQARLDQRYHLTVSPDGSKHPRLESMSPDMVFIDGDHSYEWCMFDSLLARRIIRRGGVLVWHDFHSGHIGVNKAIYELNEKEDRIVWVKGTSICFEIANDKMDNSIHIT
jgi:predicted O-methyltransferase YrrM